MLHRLHVLLWQSHAVHACDISAGNVTQLDVNTCGVSAGHMLRCKFVRHCIMKNTMLSYQL